MKHGLCQGERRIHEKTELKKQRRRKSKKEGMVREAKITSSSCNTHCACIARIMCYFGFISIEFPPTILLLSQQ